MSPISHDYSNGYINIRYVYTLYFKNFKFIVSGRIQRLKCITTTLGQFVVIYSQDLIVSIQICENESLPILWRQQILRVGLQIHTHACTHANTHTFKYMHNTVYHSDSQFCLLVKEEYTGLEVVHLTEN